MRTHSRSGYPEHSSSSPSSSSSSTSGPIIGGTFDEPASAGVGYVSVIRRALDHTLLADADTEETGSQLTTPRMSADSSGRTSTGSVSTILCAEDEEDMMCQLAEDEQDDKAVIQESVSSPGYKSSAPATRFTTAGDSLSVHASSTSASSPPSFMVNGHDSSLRSSDISQREVIIKVESSG